jgi:hypothetical protein
MLELPVRPSLNHKQNCLNHKTKPVPEAKSAWIMSLDQKQNYLDHKPSSSKNENVWTMKKNAWSIIQTVFRSQN